MRSEAGDADSGSDARRGWLRHRRGTLDLSRPVVMGILNVTPDSFSDGGEYIELERALRHAAQLVDDGASIVDIGGESTRPGAAPVPAALQIERVCPVVEALRRRSDIVISVDTTDAEVARAALTAGADIVNDISGLTFDPRLAEVIAKLGAGCFLMHTPGRPAEIEGYQYRDLIDDVHAHLVESVRAAKQAGVEDDYIALDPGFGFGKDATANWGLLRRLHDAVPQPYPLLVGMSRKRMIREAVGTEPQAVEHGTTAANVLALENGAAVIRNHDVIAARAAADFWAASHP